MAKDKDGTIEIDIDRLNRAERSRVEIDHVAAQAEYLRAKAAEARCSAYKLQREGKAALIGVGNDPTDAEDFKLCRASGDRSIPVEGRLCSPKGFVVEIRVEDLVAWATTGHRSMTVMPLNRSYELRVLRSYLLEAVAEIDDQLLRRADDAHRMSDSSMPAAQVENDIPRS